MKVYKKLDARDQLTYIIPEIPLRIYRSDQGKIFYTVYPDMIIPLWTGGAELVTTIPKEFVIPLPRLIVAKLRINGIEFV